MPRKIDIYFEQVFEQVRKEIDPNLEMVVDVKMFTKSVMDAYKLDVAPEEVASTIVGAIREKTIQ